MKKGISSLAIHSDDSNSMRDSEREYKHQLIARKGKMERIADLSAVQFKNRT